MVSMTARVLGTELQQFLEIILSVDQSVVFEHSGMWFLYVRVGLPVSKNAVYGEMESIPAILDLEKFFWRGVGLDGNDFEY